jgi:hypothetical protein
MCAPSLDLNVPTEDKLRTAFQEALPRIEQCARFHFRDLRCRDRRDDCVAEVVALGWSWLVRLAQRGRDARPFLSTLATLAARAVRSGRRVCGLEPADDVLSRRAQQRRGFAVQRLPDSGSLAGTPIEEALRDNTKSEVPAQVAFRLDFGSWRGTLTERDRRLADALLIGGRTRDVARRFGVSPGRVSQKRREFHDDWSRFCDDRPPEERGRLGRPA